MLVVGFIAASLLLRGQQFRFARTLLDFIVALPLGVPAVIFGVGFLLTYSYPPLVLYGSTWVIILVYTALMLPFGTRMLLATMIAMGNGYLEASRVCGAGLAGHEHEDRAAAAACEHGRRGGADVRAAHARVLGLDARPVTDDNVMGTVLFDYWTNGSYPTVAAIALVMTVVTGIGVVAAMAFGGRDVFDKL